MESAGFPVIGAKVTYNVAVGAETVSKFFSNFKTKICSFCNASAHDSSTITLDDAVCCDTDDIFLCFVVGLCKNIKMMKFSHNIFLSRISIRENPRLVCIFV